MRRRTHAIVWTAFAVLLLGGLYLGLRASLSGHDAGGLQSSSYALSVSQPRPGEVFPNFKTTQGSTVTLLIRSDVPGAVHVHGYEKKVDLKIGEEVTLTFTASDAGLFPLHLHDPDGSMRHLATLEVRPE